MFGESACISYYERKSLGFFGTWKTILWVCMNHFASLISTFSAHVKFLTLKWDSILRPRLRQHWQNQERWKSKKCNWLRSCPLQLWTPGSLPPEPAWGVYSSRKWRQDHVWDWVSQLQPGIFFNQHHLLSNDTLHESRGTGGGREMKADLRVQLSVYWPTNDCEFTDKELLVGFLLSGSKFICSAGILGAAFSF